HVHELSFGLTTATGQPKPSLVEFHRFADLLDRIDLRSCRRADTDTAILVPSYLSGDYPFVSEADRRAIPAVLTQSYIAASRAGLTPAVVREEEGLPPTSLTLIPSAKALTGPTFSALAERARAGAHIYLSYFAGAGPRPGGAWWPSLEPLFGVRHKLRYGIADQADPEVTLTVGKPFGAFASGDRLAIAPAGPNTAYLPLEVTGDTDVLLVDGHDQPALVRRVIGDGALYLGAYPIEYYASQRADANADDQTPLLYEALAAEAGANPDIGSSNPHVITDSLVRDDGTRFVWLINCTDTSQPTLVAMPDDITLRDVLTGEPVNAATMLDPFGIRVARCEIPCES
ncbi:MAG: beta-mannosidase, partial [Actinobacteria bacterium]|nr:beta-mannosidase [Actinomycetota bacterium]